MRNMPFPLEPPVHRVGSAEKDKYNDPESPSGGFSKPEIAHLN